MRRSIRSLSAGLAFVALAACDPPCERVCHKVRDCDVSPRLSQTECEEACTRQDALYEVWEDDVKIEAFKAHKRCIVQASCDEILADDCYDAEIYPF